LLAKPTTISSGVWLPGSSRPGKGTGRQPYKQNSTIMSLSFGLYEKLW
jgi:hypothetical protein